MKYLRRVNSESEFVDPKLETPSVYAKVEDPASVKIFNKFVLTYTIKYYFNGSLFKTAIFTPGDHGNTYKCTFNEVADTTNYTYECTVTPEIGYVFLVNDGLKIYCYIASTSMPANDFEIYVTKTPK